MTIGTIEELKSGRFAARLPRTLDPKRRRIGTYAARDEAEHMLNAAVAVARNKPLQSPGGETLRTFLATFLDRRERAGNRNIARDRRAAKRHIETAEFVDTPLRTIKRVVVKEWLDQLQREKSKRSGERLRPQTVRNALNLLRVCFQEAMDRGVMPQNPARDLRLNRATSNTTADTYTILEPEEQQRFLAAMPLDERRYYAFSIGAGLRPGEQRALLLEDVHVHVEDPYVTVRFGAPGKPTKTGMPRRVPLFGPALEAAREQKAAIRGRKNPKGIFWPDGTGRYRGERVPDEWEQWLKIAGIDREVRRYDLRHTCASALVSGWLGRRWTLEEVKEVLGHTDIKTTQRYAHLGATAIRDAVRETQAALSGPLPVQNDRNRTQAHEIAGSVLAFVNRRSRVQVSESAPQHLSQIQRETARERRRAGIAAKLVIGTRRDGMRRHRSHSRSSWTSARSTRASPPARGYSGASKRTRAG
ncbi:MAG TPA: tyrosine-type recombinase/integrase [Polyangiaceae bacterium]|jgi:integrase